VAQTYPMPLDEFADIIIPLLQSMTFTLRDRVEVSGVGTGQIITSEIGPSYWSADIAFRPLFRQDAKRINAMIAGMASGRNAFYLYDPLAAYPEFDPDGKYLADDVVTISEISSVSSEIKLAGLPGLYEIPAGTMFSFPYGASDEYQALHVVTYGSVSEAGETGLIEFRPPIDDPDLTTGVVVTLVKPFCRMKIIPGSYNPGVVEGPYTSGISFSCEQIP